MQYYAIQDRFTKRFVAGTTRVGLMLQQILSDQDNPPLLFSGATLIRELKRRHINLKHYRIVVVDVRKAEI